MGSERFFVVDTSRPYIEHFGGFSLFSVWVWASQGQYILGPFKFADAFSLDSKLTPFERNKHRFRDMVELVNHHQKRIIAAVVLVGGGAGIRLLRRSLRDALKEQQLLCSAAGLDDTSRRARSAKIAVDAVFARRLAKVMQFIDPFILNEPFRSGSFRASHQSLRFRFSKYAFRDPLVRRPGSSTPRRPSLSVEPY